MIKLYVKFTKKNKNTLLEKTGFTLCFKYFDILG